MIKKCQKIAKDIFNELGSGFPEIIYQKAFEVALRLEKIHYESQRIIPVFYKNFNIGEAISDLIINDGKGKFIIELKATSTKISPKEETQLKKYMETLNIKKGLLINFPQPDSKGVPENPEFRIVKLNINKIKNVS